MNLSIGWIELNSALKALREQLDQVKRDWNDSAEQTFEEDYWLPLEKQVLATLRAIDRLAPILAKAQRECT
jgi:hypothetical protein